MQHKFVPTVSILLLSLCLICQYEGCTAYKKVATGPKYSFEIRFGSMGGVTNFNPVFIVKSNREISKQATASAKEDQIQKMSQVQMDSIYLLLDKTNFNSLKINEVSNYTQYIEVKSEKIHNKINWYNDSQLPAEVKDLHSFLLNLIKK